MLDINEKNNHDLYYDVDKCVEFCKSIPDNIVYKDKTEYHIFWNVGLPFERKQLLPIKSYLNMKNTENNTNKEKEKEVGTVEKRYSDPLLASIVTAPSRLLKGKKDKEGR